MRVRVLVPLLALLVLLVACGDDDGGEQPSGAAPSASSTETSDPDAEFTLTSPAFDDGAPIPEGFTCDGQNQSPPLAWSGVPEQAVELALVLFDPDAGTDGFLHWTAWRIDPAAGELPEAQLPAGVIEGTNGANQVGYLGPCPPPGDEPHDYTFTLTAVAEPLDVSAGAAIEELQAAIDASSVAEAQLIGTYQRGT